MSPRTLAVAFVALFAMSAQADFCQTGQQFGPLFCGYAFKLFANAYPQPVTAAEILICDSPWPNNCFRTSTQCYYTYTGEYLCNGWQTIQQRVIGLGDTCTPTPTWYVFAYALEEAWGSRTVPIASFNASGSCGATGLGVYLPPHPLTPTPVYPTGTAESNMNVPIRWQSATDEARESPNWPVLYDLYYKYWPVGGVEPSTFALAATLPCNKDYTGNCSTVVSELALGYWKWYVVARMDVSYSVELFVRPAIFTQESGVESFTVLPSGRPVGCCR